MGILRRWLVVLTIVLVAVSFLSVQAVSAKTLDDTCPNAGSSGYYYAQAYQCYPNGITGVAGRITVDSPIVASDSWAHSLAEIAIDWETPNRTLAAGIEIGWIVAPAMFSGSMQPHLFVFPSQNGQNANCWNACGFVPVSNQTYQVGAVLQPTNTPLQFAILYQASSDRWWIRVGDGFVGYFPGNLWPGGFSSANKAEWYGEVEQSPYKSFPDSQMGNGRTAADPASALMAEIGVVTTSSPFQYANPQYLITSSQYFDLGTDPQDHGFHFGGPGNLPYPS